jgi:HSP20 family protein
LPSPQERYFQRSMAGAKNPFQFGDLLRGVSKSVRGFTPEVDVRTDDDMLRFVLDVPGVPLHALEVEVNEGVLTVAGERRYEMGEGREHVVIGRSYGPFRLRFDLPDWVDPATLRARLTDGVLTVEVEKQAALRPRRVRVLSGAPQIRALGPKPGDGEE